MGGKGVFHCRYTTVLRTLPFPAPVISFDPVDYTQSESSGYQTIGIRTSQSFSFVLCVNVETEDVTALSECNSCSYNTNNDVSMHII